MNSRECDRFCPYSDAVLALLLDGESAAQSVVEEGWEQELSAAELANHRRECEICADHVERARRLDALLAGTTDLDIDDAKADALLADGSLVASLDTTKAAVAPEVAITGPVLRRLRTGFVTAGLLLLGFGVGSQFLGPESDRAETTRRLREPVRAAPTVAVASEPTSTLDPGMIRLPDRLPNPRLRRRPRFESLSPRVLLTIASRSDDLLRAANLSQQFARASSLPDLWRFSQVWSAFGKSMIERSLHQLVTTADHDAVDLLIAAISTWSDGPALRRLLAKTRPQAGLRAHIARRWPAPAAIRAAARVGGRVMDRKLRSYGTKSLARSQEIATALASLPQRPGRNALLLDLWGDLARKHGDLDDLAIAKAWFAGLPFSSSAALRDEFANSGHASRRRHCLLAMAAQARSAQGEFLREIIAGQRLEESLLAAYALGQVVVDGDELFADLFESAGRGRCDYLLCAILACRRDARMNRIIDRLELSPEEVSFLRAGAFTPQQFTIAASLFRNRRGMADL